MARFDGALSRCDLGRPARVRLVVLVDRGHRELPIRADAIGLEVETRFDETVKVRVAPFDPVDEVIRSLVEIPPPSSERAR